MLHYLIFRSFITYVQVCLHGEMANVSDYNRALHLDFARNVLGGSGVCCHIASDGSIANGNVGDGEEYLGS